MVFSRFSLVAHCSGHVQSNERPIATHVSAYRKNGLIRDLGPFISLHLSVAAGMERQRVKGHAPIGILAIGKNTRARNTNAEKWRIVAPA